MPLPVRDDLLYQVVRELLPGFLKSLEPTVSDTDCRASWSGSCAVLECGLLCIGICRTHSWTCEKCGHMNFAARSSNRSSPGSAGFLGLPGWMMAT